MSTRLVTPAVGKGKEARIQGRGRITGTLPPERAARSAQFHYPLDWRPKLSELRQKGWAR